MALPAPLSKRRVDGLYLAGRFTPAACGVGRPDGSGGKLRHGLRGIDAELGDHGRNLLRRARWVEQVACASMQRSSTRRRNCFSVATLSAVVEMPSRAQSPVNACPIAAS
jgi:hypothetical protein